MDLDRSLLPAPPLSAPEWGAHLLDLDAYLARIGYDGPREATHETLRRVHRLHAAAISWEILDMTVGRPRVELDVPSLQRKIVENRRGGSCLETNMLFAAALERLGFPVVRHVSRVRRGSDKIRTRSHLVVLVEAEDQIWFADPGFGDESPLEPLPFRDGATHTVGDWTWKLDLDGAEWVLRSLHSDGWFDVYAFRLEQHHPIDFDMIKHFSYADPASVFVGKLVAQRGDEKVRHVLKDRVLAAQYADGRCDTAELTGPEIVRELRTTFNIAVTDEDERWLLDRFADAQ